MGGLLGLKFFYGGVTSGRTVYGPRADPGGSGLRHERVFLLGGGRRCFATGIRWMVRGAAPPADDGARGRSDMLSFASVERLETIRAAQALKDLVANGLLFGVEVGVLADDFHGFGPFR